MRRTPRILVNAATVLSALLCVATPALWWRTRHANDGVEYASARRGWGCGVYTNVGGLSPWYDDGPFGNSRGFGYWNRPPLDLSMPPTWDAERLAGLRFATHRDAAKWEPYVPLGHVAAPTAVLPAAWGVRRRCRSRPAPGACVHCGYDRRASPDRCPECGAGREARRGRPAGPMISRAPFSSVRSGRARRSRGAPGMSGMSKPAHPRHTPARPPAMFIGPTSPSPREARRRAGGGGDGCSECRSSRRPAS